jgi:methionine salvage enolase-phosphatase E1
MKIEFFDILGTVCPITFVKNLLFPYASENVEEFLRQIYEKAASDDSIKKLFEDLILLSNDQGKSMASIRSVSPFAFEGI